MAGGDVIWDGGVVVVRLFIIIRGGGVFVLISDGMAVWRGLGVDFWGGGDSLVVVDGSWGLS